MRPRLLDLLACPRCQGSLSLSAPSPAAGVLTGALACRCGSQYSIEHGIPRLLAESDQTPAGFRRLQERTRASFGYQWTAFADMVERFREDFLNYTGMPPEFFRGKTGLDAGCGFGRHLFYAASMGAEMVGMDFSAAADQAWRNVEGLPNAHVIQGDIFRPPLRHQAFDFVYSLGVLHHLPDPERGFQALLPLLKPGGAVLVWLYSRSRRWSNALAEATRRVTTQLPARGVRALALFAAVTDWVGFIGPYKMAQRTPLRTLADRWMFSRIKLYAGYPFQVSYADWFDRLAAPIRFYYDEDELRGWAERAKLQRVRVSATGRYGLRLYGEVAGKG